MSVRLRNTLSRSGKQSHTYNCNKKNKIFRNKLNQKSERLHYRIIRYEKRKLKDKKMKKTSHVHWLDDLILFKHLYNSQLSADSMQSLLKSQLHFLHNRESRKKIVLKQRRLWIVKVSWKRRIKPLGYTFLISIYYKIVWYCNQNSMMLT